MSNIETNRINGDQAIGRNLSIGGDLSVSGDAHVGHDLHVDGWLYAKNIDFANKGLFSTLAKLNEAYPRPTAGWYACVGTSAPFTLYYVENGAWTTSGSVVTINVDAQDTAAIDSVRSSINTTNGLATESATLSTRNSDQIDALIATVSQLVSADSKKTITVTANNSAMGTVSGGGTLAAGLKVTLKAVANTGYRFVRWSNGSTSAKIDVTVSNDATYMAYFEAATFSVIGTSNDTSLGTVSGSQTNVSYQSAVTLVATPKANCRFVGWYKDGVCVEIKKTLYVKNTNQNLAFTALFQRETCNVTVLSGNPDMGDVAKVTATQFVGASVQLKAYPYSGYEFLGWYQHGELISDSNPYTLTVSESCEYVARFVEEVEEDDVQMLGLSLMAGDGESNSDGTGEYDCMAGSDSTSDSDSSEETDETESE